MAFAGYMLALALQHFAKGEIDAAQKLEAAGRASDNSSRQNNLAAFELCAREAKARPESAQAGGWLAGSITTEGQAVDDESPSGELVAPPDNTGHAFSSGGPAEIISEAQDDAPDAAPSTQNITPAEPSPFGGSARPGWLG
jgi:hypothetical protein